jgi:HSP20 family molecular chaperone IbpA
MARQSNDPPRGATRQEAARRNDEHSREGTSEDGFSTAPSERQRPIQTGRDTNQRNRTGLFPQFETFRRGDKLVVRADIPKGKKDEIRVEVDNGILTISSEHREQHEEEEHDGFFRSERTYGMFYRAIPLPEGIDADQIDASFNDGVLEICFPAPKQEQTRTRRVPVK